MVGVEVAIGKAVCLDGREEPPKGRGVCDVGGFRLASTASEQATVAATTVVDDDGPGISARGEDRRVAIVGKYSPFLGRLVSLIGKVLPDVGEDPGSAADGNVSGKVALYDVEASFAIVVDHIWMAHQFFRDDVPERKEAIV